MATSRGTSSRHQGPSVEKLGPTKAPPSRRKKVSVEPEYMGIDLHRRRSVIVRMSAELAGQTSSDLSKIAQRFSPGQCRLVVASNDPNGGSGAGAQRSRRAGGCRTRGAPGQGCVREPALQGKDRGRHQLLSVDGDGLRHPRRRDTVRLCPRVQGAADAQRSGRAEQRRPGARSAKTPSRHHTGISGGRACDAVALGKVCQCRRPIP